ncbi:MAG: dihydroorotate dehydrogenase [Victivallales bacterium]|nr:dihydroorotate dehydrogenase [Victivallales bacterium]
MADLSVDLCGVKLPNPVMTASGTFGYGKEYAEFFPLDLLGAVVVKGIASFPSHGNPTPRVAEVQGGMINAIGLQGPGVEKFIHHPDYMPFLRASKARVIVNIWGRTIKDYHEVASRLDAEPDGISALEINISCPNIKKGGAAFGTDLKLASQVVAKVREATTLPLITKLSPNVPSIADLAKAVVDAGSDMISLINTIPAMSVDILTRKPRIANVTGGLSGPAVKPIAIRMVFEAASAVSVPVIGMGGIMNADDAVEFLIAGADAVAVGTAIFADPLAPIKIIDGINKYLDDRQIPQVSDIVGSIIIEHNN